MSNPTVSIIIPAYNSEKHIEKTIQSAIEQTFQDFEIIIVNDGSEDSTSEIVKSLQKTNNKIKLIHQENKGVAEARNTGINQSLGKYLAFLDSDDLWHPEKLLLQVSTIERDETIGIVSCLSVLLHDNGNILGWQAGININGFIYKEMIKRNAISCGSVPLIRKDFLMNINLFDKSLEPVEDWDLWVRICKNYKLVTISKPLVGYRRRINSASKEYTKVFEKSKMFLLKTFENDNKLSKNFYQYCMARVCTTIAALCIIDSNIDKAWRYIYLSFQYCINSYFFDSQMFKILILLLINTFTSKALSRRINSSLVKFLFGFNEGEDFISWTKKTRNVSGYSWTAGFKS